MHCYLFNFYEIENSCIFSRIKGKVWSAFVSHNSRSITGVHENVPPRNMGTGGRSGLSACPLELSVEVRDGKLL
jgi:hypothetical protein